MTTSLESDIRSLEARYVAAELSRDVAALDELFSNDVVYTTFRGLVVDKVAIIRSAAEPRMRLEAMNVSDMRVHQISDDVAVVTAHADISMHFADADLSGAFRITHVWRRGHRWQIVAVHGSRIPTAT